MYQCAQCKTTFSTLDLCVNHQCSVAADSPADSTQPAERPADRPSPPQQAHAEELQPGLQRSLQSLDDSQGPSEWTRRRPDWTRTVCCTVSEDGMWRPFADRSCYKPIH